jgi:hypothetical protein
MPGNSNRTDTSSGWNPFSGLAEDYDKIYSWNQKA